MTSLRGRFAIALAAVALLSVTITAVITLGLIRRYSRDAARADLERIATAIADEAGSGRLAGQAQMRTTRRLVRLSGATFAIVQADGTVVGEGAAIARSADTTSLSAGSRIEGEADTSSGRYAYVGVPVDNRFSRGVIVARPVGELGPIWPPMVGRVLVAGTIAALTALAISLVLAKRVVDPIRQLSEATGRMGKGDLSQRVPTSSNDEVGQLAISFNALSEALGESRRREQEFLANVSHELRSPVTAIRGYAEAFVDGQVTTPKQRAAAAQVILAESRRLETMIGDLLDLARLGAKHFSLDPGPADVSTTLREAGEAHAAQAEAAGVELSAQATGALIINTDAQRLRQILSNLIHNAIAATPPGGKVHVEAARVGSVVRIKVADTGTGIAAQHLPHVFERSYVRKASEGGSGGLGLAIVRELATALGGSVAVESNPGSGSTFIVELPHQRAPDLDATT